jgi:hypothetical protein
MSSSYIGRSVDAINNISSLDVLTFNGSDTVFNLTQNSVAFVPVSADALQIQIDGVIQSGNYTVSGSQVTFDFVPSGSSVCNGIRHFGVGLLTTVSDSSITTAKLGADSVNGSKIADNSISDEHLDNTAITGQTEKTSLADADKFLISDSAASGALKYVQKSNLGGGSLEYIQGSSSTSNATLLAQDGFVDDSKYAYYKIWFYSRRTSEAQTISARFRASGSELTVNSYKSHVSSHTSAGEADNSYASTFATIETDMSTRSAIWEFDMMPHIGINNNSSYLVGRGFNYKYNSDSPQLQRLTVGGFLYNENVDVDGIQFEVSGGFARHELRIYGVKP